MSNKTKYSTAPVKASAFVHKDYVSGKRASSVNLCSGDKILRERTPESDSNIFEAF